MSSALMEASFKLTVTVTVLLSAALYLSSPEYETVILALPAATALILPSSSTVTTDELLEA